MKIKTYLVTSAAAFALAACGNASDAPTIEDAETPPIEAAAAEVETNPVLAEVASGAYSLEKTHAFTTVSVGHNGGISQYRISFTDFDGALNFDASNPTASSVSFTINPAVVETNYPGDYKAGHENSEWESWNEDVSRDAKWLNADEHPEITFVSTSASQTGASAGTVTGDLTLLGVTQPVTLDVSFNGVANPPWFEGRDVIGFSASTKLKRSDFGMAAYIPNIGDEVSFEFSGEFLQDE